MRYRLLFIFLTIILAGCATTISDRLVKIAPGMDKSEVIDQMGSPDRTIRRDNEDIWFYQEHSESDIRKYEISFKESQVTYAGVVRSEDDLRPRGIKTPEEASEVLRRELKGKQKP